MTITSRTARLRCSGQHIQRWRTNSSDMPRLTHFGIICDAFSLLLVLGEAINPAHAVRYLVRLWVPENLSHQFRKF